MQEGLPRLAAQDVLCDHPGAACGPGFRGHMRRDGDTGMRPEWMVLGQGLLAKDVERGMADLPAVQRCQKCLIIDQRAAARLPAKMPYNSQMIMLAR